MGALRARLAFNNPTLTVVAIESIGIKQRITSTGCQLFGNLEPTAVVVCAPDVVFALDMSANPIDLDRLRQDVPELDVVIAEVNSPGSSV